MYNQLFRIAIPIAFQHLMVALNSLLDNFMVSKVGAEAVAAAGSANKYMNVARLVMFGIASGSSILTTQFHAKKDKKGVTRAFFVNLILSLIFACGFAIFYFVNRINIVSSFSSDLEIQRLALSYMDISVFSAIVLSTLYPRIVSLRARGVVNFPFIMTTVMLITNFSLNYILIFGNFGFPKMGLRGAAIATLISEVFITITGYIGARIIGYKTIEKVEYIIKIPLGFIKKYISLALPILVANFLWSYSLVMIHNIFGMIGKDALAAFGVLSPVETLISYLFSGFGHAALIIVGRDLGKNNFQDAYQKAKDISLIGAITAGFMGSLVYFFSGYIARLWSLEGESFSYLTSMISIFGMFLWVRIFNSISLNGIFRSGGDSSFIFWVVIITSWLITVPMTYAGFYFLNWGPREIYWGANFVEALMALIFVLRFRSKKWMRNLLEKEIKGEK